MKPSLSSRRSLRRLLVDARGLSTVEYIIILCLIAVVGFALWKQFGQRVEGKTRGATTVVGGLPTSSSS
jgi:Flp pilus assembly pilin Flp